MCPLALRGSCCLCVFISTLNVFTCKPIHVFHKFRSFSDVLQAHSMLVCVCVRVHVHMYVCARVRVGLVMLAQV